MDGELLAFAVGRSALSSLAILPGTGALAALRAEDSTWYGVGWDGSAPTFLMPVAGILETGIQHDVPEWVRGVKEGAGLRARVRDGGVDVRWYEAE
jgi:hypothetical protein